MAHCAWLMWTGQWKHWNDLRMLHLSHNLVVVVIPNIFSIFYFMHHSTCLGLFVYVEVCVLDELVGFFFLSFTESSFPSAISRLFLYRWFINQVIVLKATIVPYVADCATLIHELSYRIESFACIWTVVCGSALLGFTNCSPQHSLISHQLLFRRPFIHVSSSSSIR